MNTLHSCHATGYNDQVKLARIQSGMTNAVKTLMQHVIRCVQMTSNVG